MVVKRGISSSAAAGRPASVDSELHRQRRANQSTLAAWDRFAEHRASLTQQCLPGAGDSAETLCVLGAGNCNDLDLAVLAGHYAEIHLVDLDEEALLEAKRRQSPLVAERVVCHPPLDLSGMLGQLVNYKNFLVTEEQLMAQPGVTVRHVVDCLGQRFDRVVSPCVLTQLQLSLLEALGEAHPLLPAIAQTLTVSHLRTIYSLTEDGGWGLLATELASNENCCLDAAEPASLRALAADLVRSGNIIGVSHPGHLSQLIEEDPVLRGASCKGVPDLEYVWRWQQGPERWFLNYSLHLNRPEGAL